MCCLLSHRFSPVLLCGHIGKQNKTIIAEKRGLRFPPFFFGICVRAGGLLFAVLLYCFMGGQTPCFGSVTDSCDTKDKEVLFFAYFKPRVFFFLVLLRQIKELLILSAFKGR